jgi:hypothetical protein
MNVTKFDYPVCYDHMNRSELAKYARRLEAYSAELEARTAIDWDAVKENADRLMRACEIVLIHLAHPEGASWPLLYDVLRSRMYTYTEARDGIEAAQRYGRAAMEDAAGKGE